MSIEACAIMITAAPMDVSVLHYIHALTRVLGFMLAYIQPIQARL